MLFFSFSNNLISEFKFVSKRVKVFKTQMARILHELVLVVDFTNLKTSFIILQLFRLAIDSNLFG